MSGIVTATAGDSWDSWHRELEHALGAGKKKKNARIDEGKHKQREARDYSGFMSDNATENEEREYSPEQSGSCG